MMPQDEYLAQAGVRDGSGRLLALWTVLCIMAGMLLGALWMQVQEQEPLQPEKVYEMQGDWTTVNALRRERDAYRFQLDSVMASYWGVPWKCQ